LRGVRFRLAKNLDWQKVGQALRTYGPTILFAAVGVTVLSFGCTPAST